MDGTVESLFIVACLAILGLGGAALLAWLAVVRPRLGLYALLAGSPTQFLFIPAGSFFVSPADILAMALAAGLTVRLAAGSAAARSAVRQHVLLGLLLVAYLAGFVLLGHLSRTLVRLPLAILPSILACELLVTRRHFALATAALVVAGLVDAAYGLAYIAAGAPLHPTRFSGMMGVNFSAIAIITAAAIAGTRVARSREPLKLLAAGVVALLGLATLSKMGVLALAIAGACVIWPLATPRNRRLVATAAVVLVLAGLSHGGLRERLLARAAAEVQHDGVMRTSTDVRQLILATAWEALGDRPLLGIGFFGFQQYSLRNVEILRSTAGQGYGTHNTYVEVLVEGGVLAFAAFLLHFLSYARGLPAWWAAIGRHDVPAAAALAGLIVVLVSAGVANVLLHYHFWGVCGVALACVVRLRTGLAGYGRGNGPGNAPRESS
jgi:O-antigen ligase